MFLNWTSDCVLTLKLFLGNEPILGLCASFYFETTSIQFPIGRKTDPQKYCSFRITWLDSLVSRLFTVFFYLILERIFELRSPGCILNIVLYGGASHSFMTIYIKSYQKCTEKVNQYEWGNSKLQSRDHKVYYRTLRIIGSSETIEIKTGSHIIIENQD